MSKTLNRQLQPHFQPHFVYIVISFLDFEDMKIIVSTLKSRIAARIGRIVDTRLVPRMPGFGMKAEEYRRYEGLLG